MSRCPACGHGPVQAGFRFCPWCARPVVPPSSSPAASEASAPWTWRDWMLMATAFALGITILLALVYLVFWAWLQSTLLFVVAWLLVAWLGYRIVVWRLTPPTPPSLPIRRRPLTDDDAHDAAIGIAAVLGARDAIHRR